MLLLEVFSATHTKNLGMFESPTPEGGGGLRPTQLPLRQYYEFSKKKSLVPALFAFFWSKFGPEYQFTLTIVISINHCLGAADGWDLGRLRAAIPEDKKKQQICLSSPPKIFTLQKIEAQFSG